MPSGAHLCFGHMREKSDPSHNHLKISYGIRCFLSCLTVTLYYAIIFGPVMLNTIIMWCCRHWFSFDLTVVIKPRSPEQRAACSLWVERRLYVKRRIPHICRSFLFLSADHYCPTFPICLSSSDKGNWDVLPVKCPINVGELLCHFIWLLQRKHFFVEEKDVLWLMCHRIQILLHCKMRHGRW